MFGKDKSVAISSKMETVIGNQTIIQGSLSSKGTIRVDGKVEGGISEAATVIISDGGEVSGDINAGSVVVGGHVIGNIIATHSIEMLPNAQIHGDIKTGSLAISEGASFEGNCIMTHEKSQVIQMNNLRKDAPVPAAANGKPHR